MNDDLKLHTRIEVSEGVLLLHYRVENLAQRDVYLLNRVPNRALEANPDIVYVELLRDQKLVAVSKKIPAIPPGMNPTMPIAPYVTAVRAGESFTETVRLPLPVHEYREYEEVQETGHTATYRAIQFTLAYYWSVAGMQERKQQIVPGVEVLIPQPPPGTQISVQELQGPVQSVEIAVFEPVAPGGR